MKRVFGFLFVIAGASCAVAVGSPVSPDQSHPAKPVAKSDAAAHAAVPRAKLAPADEYFGPLKMSVLGIRNVIHDLTIRYEPTWDADHHLANSIMSTAVMTEASLHDWETKYPADDQLARAVYLLQHLYAKIETNDAQSKANYCAKWLASRYSRTWYAKNMRVTMSHPVPATPVTPATSTGTTPSSSETVTPPGGTTAPSAPSAPQGSDQSKPATIEPVPPVPAPSSPASTPG